MGKSIYSLLVTLFILCAIWSCRETKTTEKEVKGDVERAVDEAAEGIERAGEEVKGAYKDVKEEVDGGTDDN